MEIRLRTKDEIEVFKVLVDSLKSDLNKTLVSIECDTPQAITSDNNKIEILKFFIEEFKNDQSSWDAQNCVGFFEFLFFIKYFPVNSFGWAATFSCRIEPLKKIIKHVISRFEIANDTNWPISYSSNFLQISYRSKKYRSF